ncbi:MAG: glycosyl transferase family 2 [Planctomycetota bacterium]|nr:glycosyl transferase family 2 [Planctomycetota bacterium]
MIRISVVVPTYRRPELLSRCLVAIAAQNFDRDGFEIVVADDAASEATRRQVEAFAASRPVQVRYFAVIGNHGPAAARNVGWRGSRGHVIAFTDDDCVPDQDWLREGVAALTGGFDAATGRVIVPLPDQPTDYERDAAGLEAAEFVTANCFCRREAIEAVGGFDERFSAAWREDSDLHFSLLRSGRRVVHAPAASVIHPVRPAPWGVSLRQQRKSLFDALLFKKHPGLYRERIRASPPWAYYAIVGSLGLAAVARGLGRPALGTTSLLAWALLTARFSAKRLEGTSHAPGHVVEMLATSALIPPLSVFWRLYGACKFAVPFL